MYTDTNYKRDELLAETKSLADQVRDFYAKAAHAERLAETLKWIRKHPDVLKDSFFAGQIDAQLDAWEGAQP